MSKLEYKMIGEDLPELYKNKQDPLLHYGESWILAEGEGWVAMIRSCGEVRTYIKSERVGACELPDYYETDEALAEAERKGELDIANNNWYEVEFYRQDEDDRLIYLDLVADDCVCYSFDEALEVFKSYVEDDKWCDELMKYVKEAKD